MVKLLLDEGTIEDFIELIPACEVRHVNECGWKGLKNGALLDAAAESGFAAMITVDKQMRHQQNMANRSLSLIVLDVHPISASNQAACLKQVLEIIPNLRPAEVFIIEGPHPKRDE